VSAIHSIPGVLSVGSALPPHYADQQAILDTARRFWKDSGLDLGKLDSLHRATRVQGRYLALPLEEYGRGLSFGKANTTWLQVATDVGAQALQQALAAADLNASAIDHLFFVTVTGVATPNIDARLINRLELRPDTRRPPMFGLGCLGGATGLARAADYLRAFPDHVAALVAVELCSLTLQREDASMANSIASALFGDGAAAAILAGAGRAESGPRVVASRSIFYPETEAVMGWETIDTGFKLVLSPKVPQIIGEHIAGDVDRFLASQGLRRDQIRHWVCHPGGPKILEVIQASLGLADEALEPSWRTLAEVGNISSASVLFVLQQVREQGAPGDYGLVMAMGPGFGTELVLLRW
jgi:alkylresorcinol/alkylpyrone synthase